MQADKVLASILDREGLDGTDVSRRIGRNPTFLRSYIYRGIVPGINTMARICDAVEYDLIIRSRADGFEFTIDPPIE